MRLMVTGGAGYIGTHVVRLLREQGDEVVVVDDLSSGLRERVPADVDLVELDLAAPAAPDVLERTLRATGCTAVVHLAARKDVAESMARPLYYYEQNLGGLAHVLAGMRSAQVDRLVFSSSAAVYGATDGGLVGEETPTAPVNPYGRTKLAGEWLVRDAARAWGLRQVSLRYFNVAGAGWPDLGDPTVASLVTSVLARWAAGLPALVHGDDYPTPDGSCVRDYVHVLDLATAHLAALRLLDRDGPDADPAHDVLNIGTGRGASVLEMVSALERAGAGRAAGVLVGPRRPGDPAQVVADPARARQVLTWRPQAGLQEIAASAWAARTTTATG